MKGGGHRFNIVWQPDHIAKPWTFKTPIEGSTAAAKERSR